MKLVSARPNRHPRTWRGPRKDTPAGKSRVFVAIENETLFENLVERTTRPYAEWKPFVLEGLKQLGIENVKLHWSQKAGCSMCPCSPGFYIDGHFGQDFWVTLDAEKVPQTDDRSMAAARAQALANSLA